MTKILGEKAAPILAFSPPGLQNSLCTAYAAWRQDLAPASLIGGQCPLPEPAFDILCQLHRKVFDIGQRPQRFRE
ncbi:hypothetical protein [Bordetella trematum]|uniref:hypothetical protein n=1 Tax=Bordetella trematum TaxID=123899 RepID=UPI00398906BD